MNTIKSDFNKSLFRYMRSHGAEPRKELLDAPSPKVISHFKSYFVDNLFSYSLEKVNVSELNLVEDIFISQSSNIECDFYEIDHGKIIRKNGHQVTIELEEFTNANLYRVKRIANKHDENSLYNTVVKLTPKVGYIAIPLVIFGVLTPLYSNVFNSRLVHTTSANTFWLITSFFLFFVAVEYILKKYIKNKTFYQNQKNISVVSEYFFGLFKMSNADNLTVKVRSIEQAVQVIWDNRPLLYVDMAFVALYTFSLSLLLGYYSSILIVYYFIIFIFMYGLRFKSYVDLLSTLRMSGEKTSFLYSLEHKKRELYFVEQLSAQSVFMEKYTLDDINRHALDIQNHHWSELVRINTFVSMVIMFFACYLALQSNALLMSSLIAVMIINSRLSSSLTSSINRFYQLKVQKHHFFESGSSLFKDIRFSDGVKIKKISQIQTKVLSNEILTKKKITPLDLVFDKEKTYAITGASGIGKTTLLRLVGGEDIDYSGEILFNNVSSKHLSIDCLGVNISYHHANMQFLKASLKVNFEFYGIVDLKRISEILKFASPQFELDMEKFEILDADRLGFSNGEKQKLLLAMVLEKKPSVIILDESTSFLSMSDSLKTITWVRHHHPESIIILATHDSNVANLSDERIHLQPNIDSNRVVVNMR